MDRDEAISLLLSHRESAGIFTDFDGSLSPIVATPDAARPVEGAVAAMTALAATFPLVAVVSGRSLEDLRTRFAPRGVLLCGAYGRERSDSMSRLRPEGWETVVIAAGVRTRGLTGVVVEPKGQGVSLHYRLAPGARDSVHAIAEELAHEFGLDLRAGRQVVELIAPGPGKGDLIADLVQERGLTAVVFAGDDLADVEAFEAVRALGMAAVLVGVESDESPAGLTESADIVVDGPRSLVMFLHDLGGGRRGGVTEVRRRPD